MDYQCTLSPNSKRLGEHDETKPSLLVGKMGILVPFSFPQRKARSLVQQIEYRPNHRLSSPIQSFTKKNSQKELEPVSVFKRPQDQVIPWIRAAPKSKQEEPLRRDAKTPSTERTPMTAHWQKSERNGCAHKNDHLLMMTNREWQEKHRKEYF